MILSMTGFGSGCREGAGSVVTVEVKSVNHRFIKTQIRLPRELAALETDVEARVRTRLARGAVNVSIACDRRDRASGPSLDEAAARGAHARLVALFAELNPGTPAPAPVAMFEQVLRAPGIWADPAATGATSPDLEKALFDALDAALAANLESRRVEGVRLHEFLAEQHEVVRTAAVAIAERAPKSVRDARDRFVLRVNQLMAEVKPEVTIDEAALVREAASAADRSDITEELHRLTGHLERFSTTLADGREVGRKLDFLLQEMLREANTVASKAADLAIAHLVVEAKAAIEKMKEQVQNLE